MEVGGGTRHRRHNLTATIGLVVHAAGQYVILLVLEYCLAFKNLYRLKFTHTKKLNFHTTLVYANVQELQRNVT